MTDLFEEARDWRLDDLLLPALMLSDANGIDPLGVLLDPDFTEVLWDYEHSRVHPMVPGSLHGEQISVLDAATYRHRMLFWGNQSGKTTTGAIDCVLGLLGRHPHQKWQPPLIMWASALTWELWEKILLPELLTWLPPDRIVDAPEPYVKSTKRTIMVRADNGSVSRIEGKSAEQGSQKYQSARVHQIWFDEEHPESIWDEAIPRLVRYGGRTITTATPLLGLTWLYHRLYMGWKNGTLPDVWASHAGMADNPSIAPEEIAQVERQFRGDPSQAKARLYGEFAKPSGLALAGFDPNRNLETWTTDMRVEVADNSAERTDPSGEKVPPRWTHLAGIDFGYWRFGFVHLVVDRANRGHAVREYFSQKQVLLEVRARWIHDHLRAWGAPDGTRIYGDSANPTDIAEINREFERIGSPYRVRPVDAENKARQASVTLINNLFARGALMIRRDIDEGDIWYRGMDAASDGDPMGGSRLLYEIGQWRYEKPKSDDKVQSQDPVDATADGADLIAALRYASMSHWRAAKKPKPKPKPRNPNMDYGLERIAKQAREMAKAQGIA